MDDELEVQVSRGMDFGVIATQLLNPPDTDDIGIIERHEFVEKIARGYGHYYAGLAVGWSEAQIKRALKDPEMADLIALVDEYKNDTVEYAILRSAQAGNVMAQKMWANAKMPERGWVEKRTHVIEGQARVDVVHSVREALQTTLQGDGAIAGLHAAYVDTDIVEDAE
ncbi:MAG: hypothetical protein KJN63_10575 [Acidimicrobiia bacterium]|nr:hypothetical protein [Acidimicrobiia bacterium]